MLFVRQVFRPSSPFPLIVCAIILAGCESPPPPPPDGSSGIRGVCLLPAEDPDEDGKVPERRRWPGVIIIASHTNITSKDTCWGREYRATADASGSYTLPLNPGDYLISPHDPERLKGMAITPMVVKVEAGRFADVTIDYDKIQMRPVRLKSEK